MARSDISTLLPLDRYAQIMQIPGWYFNQIIHPDRPYRGNCERIWMQSGYYDDPNHVMGRDAVAQAIATAEERIAERLGFWPAPVWIRAEPIAMNVPERNEQAYYNWWNTRYKTAWGYLISGGVQAWEKLDGLYGTAVVYSDRDGDGIDDWATVTFVTTEPQSTYEIEIVPIDHDPSLSEWRIRPLQVTLDTATNTYTMEGPRWLFVDPDYWLTPNENLRLDDDTYFLEFVEVYRHYNDTTDYQVQYQWVDPQCDTTPCNPVCQSACMNVEHSRQGIFTAPPSTYGSGAWVTATPTYYNRPTNILAWYYSGYREYRTMGYDRTRMSRRMQEAIVHLANAYLPEAPCGCAYTQQVWRRDNEEQEVNSIDVALAASAFGTTKRGAVFAYSTIKSLEPIGQGG